MDVRSLPEQSRDQIFSYTRTAHVLYRSYLTEANRMKSTGWIPSVGQEALMDNNLAALTQNYQGIWSNLAQAARLLPASSVDAQHFQALVSQRRMDYLGYAGTNDEIEFDMGQVDLADKALQCLKDLFPGAVWDQPMDPEADAFVSQIKSKDATVQIILTVLGVIFFLGLLILQLSS